MRFAAPLWLFGTGLAVVIAVLLILGGVGLMRAIRRFGDEDRIAALVTQPSAARRAAKGILLVLAVASLFLAAAQPQYGRGTRKIPATNLDVVIALDYSKSMYAQDVPPSRSSRAKAEVARLVQELAGARFGAVAFAGEPLSFPLTGDGAAIAQFFRQLTPNDMPVGGTAIARALEAARALFKRDPSSAKHRKVIVLVTDGEDLEGDPVSVAQAAAADQIAIHVVQIGGRTPEPVPQVSDQGTVVGIRQDSEGRPLTTSLSAEGEKQLASVAEAASGNVVRSESGDTKISVVTAALRRMMTEELSETVETVYADVYAYPLGLAVLLLFAETFVAQVRRPWRRRLRKRGSSKLASGVAGVTTLILLAIGCADSTRDPHGIFSRYSPVVDRAVAAIETQDAGAAQQLLIEYLDTGRCKAEGFNARQAPSFPQASFDLGLTLFELGERYGQHFGEENAEQPPTEARLRKIDCARALLEMIAHRLDVPLALRARANYLRGNLEFLRQQYADAVTAYDACLRLSPALSDPGADGIGKDCAHNRAIALARKQEQEDNQPKQDGGASDENSDSKSGDGGTSEPDSSNKPDGGAGDSNDEKDQQDQSENEEQPEQDEQGGDDEQKPQEDEQEPPESSEQEQPQPEPPQQGATQDQRMLDLLEDAPTLQQEAAKRQRGRVRLRMEDK